MKLCPCGSGLERIALHDARGIFVTFICDGCEEEKVSGYRPEIFSNPNYHADEPIENPDYDPDVDWGDDPLGAWHGRNE